MGLFKTWPSNRPMVRMQCGNFGYLPILPQPPPLLGPIAPTKGDTKGWGLSWEGGVVEQGVLKCGHTPWGIAVVRNP